MPGKYINIGNEPYEKVPKLPKKPHLLQAQHMPLKPPKHNKPNHPHNMYKGRIAKQNLAQTHTQNAQLCEVFISGYGYGGDYGLLLQMVVQLLEEKLVLGG